MNGGVWIKPSGSTYAPKAWVSVVCEVNRYPHARYVNHTVETLSSIHVAASSQRRGHWSEPLYRHFISGDHFFDWLEAYGSEKKKTHIVSPVVNETFRLTGFLDRINVMGSRFTPRTKAPDSSAKLPGANGSRPDGTPDRPPLVIGGSRARECHYHFNTMILSGKPDIVKYRAKLRSFQWVSACQYFTSSEDDVASAIGYQWPVTHHVQSQLIRDYRDPAERAFMWLRAMQYLSDWWCEVDGGPWQATIGGMAYSYIRKGIPPKTVLNHKIEPVKLLEESALFGGRQQVYFVGNIGWEQDWKDNSDMQPGRSKYPSISAPITHVDVRSMYPHLLATYDYPLKLVFQTDKASVKDLLDLNNKYGLIARVTLNTDRPCYPYRSTDSILYPLGVFRTSLTSPELMYAVSQGHVARVHYLAAYKLGNPFADQVNKLLSLRALARERKEVAMEMLIKHLSNAIAGKLAQRRYSWIECHDVNAPIDFGSYITVNADNQQTMYYRVLSGLVWRRQDASHPHRPMGAAFAFLTAYGRMMMHRLIELMPDRSVISMDTDGMWVFDKALKYLPLDQQGSETLPGDIRITDKTNAARFWGPQHYWYGRGFKMAGFSMPVMLPGSNRIGTLDRINTTFSGDAESRNAVVSRLAHKFLNKLDVGGTVKDDGWVSPPKLWTPLHDDDTRPEPHGDDAD